MPSSCLILGSGMAGLSLGALLARAGVEVTILEAHPELIGGCAHTFAVGEYRFTAGPRYLWNFGPGQIGQRFLQKCALTERVPLVELDRRGFDHIYVGGDEPIRVPNGWPEYEELLKERFPAEVRGIGRFFGLCRKVFQAFEVIDELGLYLEPWSRVIARCFWRRPRSTTWILLHRHITLQQVFELCGLGQRLRTVLFAHGGIFALPAGRLSFHGYVAATLFYHRGCYYPRNDMEGFIGALAKIIETRRGRILRGQRVVSVEAGRQGVSRVKTDSGECFAADVVVVNYDPGSFLKLIGDSGGTVDRHLPNYRHSLSMSSLFLGVRDRRVLEPVFGKWNVWYRAGVEPDPGLFEANPLDEPRMLYLNSPTLVKGVANDAPPGHATLTGFAPCNYQAFKDAGPEAKQVMKEQHASLLIDTIERRFLPGLRGMLDAIHLRTPEEKEQIWSAPGGNVYGRSLEPAEVWKKVPFKGILPGLYFVGSHVSFAGISSVIHGACRVYEELTGDRV